MDTIGHRKRKPAGNPKDSCSKCNGPLGSRYKKQRYCAECHAAWSRENRVRHSELTDDQRMRANARSYLNTYLRRGYITKNPCIICGSCEVQGHHENYNKPLEVVWLCKPHHRQYHNELIEGDNSGIVQVVKEKYNQLYAKTNTA